jgi:hypothetical protein
MACAFLYADRDRRRHIQKPIQSRITVRQSKHAVDGDNLRSGALMSGIKFPGVETLPDRLHESTFSVCLDLRQTLYERAQAQLELSDAPRLATDSALYNLLRNRSAMTHLFPSNFPASVSGANDGLPAASAQ